MGVQVSDSVQWMQAGGHDRQVAVAPTGRNTDCGNREAVWAASRSSAMEAKPGPAVCVVS